jgi:hypothetical protein
MTRGAARGGFLRASLLLGALAGSLLSCHPSPPPPEVEYSGCWAFYSEPEPVCSLFPDPDRRLRLWVRAPLPNEKIEIHAGGQSLVSLGVEINGGRYYRLDIPKQADQLTVSLLLPDGNRGSSWSLRLAESDKPWWFDEIKDLPPPEAKRRLENLKRSALPKNRGVVWRQLALLARLEGDSEKEELYLKEGISADRSNHCWSGELEKVTRLAGLYIGQGRFGDAEQILAKLQFPPKAPADAKYLTAFHWGLLGEADGDYRSALEQLQKTYDLAGRLRVTKYLRQAEQVQVRVLQHLGRSREASALVESLLNKSQLDPNNPCDRGDLLNNAGWFWLFEHESGKDAKDPTQMLEQAQSEFEKNRCTREKKLNARLNLALAYQQAGRWPEAQRELDQARAVHAKPNLAEFLWWDDLEAREEIAKGHAGRALDLYEELGKKAVLVHSPEGTLRALLGRAKAHIALNQRPDAIEALAEADREMEEQSRHIPVQEGLDTFFAYQEAATRRYLSLLLEDRQKKSAFDLARRSRSRLLRQLAVRDRLRQLTGEKQQSWLALLSKYNALRNAVDNDAADRWKLAASEDKHAREAEATNLAEARKALDSALSSLPHDTGEGELSPSRPEEVILIYHPLPEGKWVAFAATQVGIEVAYPKLPAELPTNLETLASILLKPSRSFELAIGAARSVRILAYGPLRSVDFHALPFAGGEPLMASRLVAYSLDLPLSSPPSIDGRLEALVVSNPKENLPEANKEAGTVATAVKAWRPSWKLTPLNGRDARSDAVLRALPYSRLFHYAGHGIFAGFAGWDSELPLANNSRLTLGDVLALRPVPAWVVLSACDAARTSQEAPGEGIGLANAFLLAGSQQVVAATRPVVDRSANDLMTELYGEWQPGEDLAHALQRAQRAGYRKDPSARGAWASFRLLVP